MSNILIVSCLIIVPVLISCYYYNKESVEISFFDRNVTQTLKGVSILLIIVCHLTDASAYGRIFTPLGGIGVMIFLFLSGFGLNESYKRKGLNKFWTRRLLKVWIPYFLIFCCISPFYDISFLSKEWLLNVFCIRCKYWFVSYIIICYITFWITTKFAHKYRIVIIVFLSLLSFCYFPPIKAEQALSFISGILFSENYKNISCFFENNKRTFCVAINIFIIGIIALIFKQTDNVRETEILLKLSQLITKYCIGLSILLFTIHNNSFKSNKYLKLTGDISYELYLVHFPFFGLIGNSTLVCFFFFIGCFICSWIFHKSVDFLISKIDSVSI